MINYTYVNYTFSHDKVTNRRKFTCVHYHNDYELYYLINGKTKYFIEDEIFLIDSGAFVIVPPGKYHMTDSEGCLHNERILIAFREDEINPQIKDILDVLCKRKVMYLSGDKTQKAEAIFEKMETEYQSGFEKNMFLFGLYIQEILVLLYRGRLDSKPKLKTSDEITQNVIKYIGDNYASELSLQKLGRIFAISESHLSRRFKACAGIGLTEYITYVRILNAENLLKTTTLPITDIAEQCGFNDSNYFSTVFKKIKGITPHKFAIKFREK